MNDSDSFDLKDRLKVLPIWPVIGVSNPCIAACKSLVPSDYELLLPWMSGHGQFLRSEIANSYFATLESLGVQKIADINLVETHILQHLPRSIGIHEEKDYASLIAALSRVCEANHPRNFSKRTRNKEERKRFIYRLRDSNLAPDGNGLLHPANALFDHTDSVFLAAFREEAATRFLMKAVRHHKRLWLDIGLKQKEDTYFKTSHYVLCLKTMRKRLEAWNALPLDTQLASDARAVLEPLTSTIYNPYFDFSGNEWLAIQKEAIFPTLAALNGQPNYRRDSMANLAASRPLLPLKDLVMLRYTPICWSQIPFPLVEPSQATFSKITSQGRPPASMVWNHLENLMQLAQRLTEDAIPSFLFDLTSTYDYLQEYLTESCNAFVHVTSMLWLNLAITDNALVSLDDLRSSWFKIEHLVLSSPCDTPPLMSVQPRLMRYERLLKALGCRTIVYPTIARPKTSKGESLSALMTRMRHEGRMLDITLSAEGKDVQVHKNILTAASDYFAVHTSGRWAEQERIELKEISFHTLSRVVDFIYADVFDWTPMRATDEDILDVKADKLDNLLDLLTAADRFLLLSLRAQVEDEILSAGRILIRIDNVLDIRIRADGANARHLEKLCTEFYEQNKVPVDLIYEGREI
jgi:sacsin